jgi:sulfiredoxin
MSIQTRSKTTITDVPLDQILRPIVPVIDESKVSSMVCTLQRAAALQNEKQPSIPYETEDLGVVAPPTSTIAEETAPTELPPVDVLHYKSQAKGDMYFAFGGCHRLKAHEKAGVPMVRCKVIPATKGMLKMYLGASVDRITGD